MSDAVIVSIALGFGVVCFGLAYRLWMRPQSLGASAPADGVTDEQDTALLPGEELFESNTEYLDPPDFAVRGSEDPEAEPTASFVRERASRDDEPTAEFARVVGERRTPSSRDEDERTTQFRRDHAPLDVECSPGATELIPSVELPTVVRRGQPVDEAPAADLSDPAQLRSHPISATQALAPPVFEAREHSISTTQPLLSSLPAIPVPEPAPVTEPAVSGLTTDELGPLFEDAVAAFGKWRAQSRAGLAALRALASGPEEGLRRALALVSAASEDASRDVLERELREADSEQARSVAALALLGRHERRALDLFAELLGDDEFAAQLRRVLRLWSKPETDWHILQQARGAGEHRTFWLDLVESRRIDPRAELLDELLSSDDPELLRRGLELAKYHDDPELRRKVARPHLHAMKNPELRMAAVELSLLDGEMIAWMLCRQMANAPDYPRATGLVASLSSASELEPLLRRVAGGGGESLWAVCQSGRPAAASLAAERLVREPEDEFAAAGLRYIIRGPEGGGDDVDALLEHWYGLEPSLHGDRRYLYGGVYGEPDAICRCLASADERHFRALGDELFLRSRGVIRWTGAGFGADVLARLDALDTTSVDFEQMPGRG